MRVKIGIMGTHGTGKTAFAHSLLGKLKELGLNAGITREYVRECPLPIGTESRNSLDAQAWVIGKQFIEEIETQAKFDVVVCDRTVMDNYAYFLWNYNKNPVKNVTVEISEDIVRKWSKTYDLILRLPIPTAVQTSLTKDGFRSTDVKWQREIDDLLNFITKELGLETKWLPFESNKKRVERVVEMLKL